MSSFGGSIKLTGEDEYRKALKNITQGLKEVSSELTLTTSQFDASDKKTKDLKQAQEQLAKVYENQKAKVDELKNAYNSFSQKVAEQSTKHQQLLQTYDKEKAELEKIGRTLGTTSKEYQDQRSKVESLAQEVAKSTKNEEENANALSRMGTALNKAETELNKTSKEMKDLGHDTKETSEGFSVFKMVLANLTTQAINSAIKGLQSLGGALINVGKQALQSYADYEQLVGGVETLFKDSAGIVQDYANEAYKTAGLSANEYMETVTSFSASLLQSLDGDTKKTAEYSNRAIIDMSDNANKMGTDMSSLQNAYQGFAKQNYTMLDNLKLGYGGTKSEMERLIKDASKMKDVQKELGVEVDASSMSFGNIVNAISVMQKSMDIAGTTSKEASTTMSVIRSGSISSNCGIVSLIPCAKLRTSLIPTTKSCGNKFVSISAICGINSPIYGTNCSIAERTLSINEFIAPIKVGPKPSRSEGICSNICGKTSSINAIASFPIPSIIVFTLGNMFPKTPPLPSGLINVFTKLSTN